MKVMDSLRTKIAALLKNIDDSQGELLVECKSLCTQLISTVNKTKKDFNMSRWIHMPKLSEEYEYYRLMCGNYEGFAYEMLGITVLRTEEGMMTAITHFKKARAFYNLIGMAEAAKRVEGKIDGVTAQMQSNDERISPAAACSLYENNLKRNGMDSEDTIRAGILYSRGLRGDSHCIEAERLVTKLSAVSRRVLGPDHKTTFKANEVLKEFKERDVHVLPGPKLFQALRYENDGEICVVQGPITDKSMFNRNTANEKMYHIANSQVIPSEGCAVICHGLISASHMNGELGEVRNIFGSGTEIRLGVNFEKKGVKSALVKPVNLRIAFELPELGELNEE